jgi:hypothetical protein
MRLSIAVAAKAPFETGPFLAALQANAVFARDDVEVHLTHDQPLRPPLMEPPANLHLHHCPEVRSILRLWGIALARASGTYVAALDVNCPPEPGWLNRVSAEIDRAIPLFFGPVEPGWPARDPRSLGYVIEYAQFKRPLARTLAEVPGNNIVCRRELLAPPAELVARGFYKTFTLWRLEREHGLVPARFDDMAVVYRKPFAMRHYLKRRLVHGRCFGGTRHSNPGQPAKLLCAAFTPLLPFLRTARIYRAVRPDDGLRTAFVRLLPRVMLAETAWSVGEFLGYARGERGACTSLD